MKKFLVTVRRHTQYEVEAKDDQAAIDAVLEGEGDEVGDDVDEVYSDEVTTDGETK